MSEEHAIWESVPRRSFQLEVDPECQSLEPHVDDHMVEQPYEPFIQDSASLAGDAENPNLVSTHSTH